MSVDAGGVVEVVLPARLPASAADDAVAQLRPWIESRQAALAAARREYEGPAGTIPYLGEPLRVIAESGRSRVTRRGDALLVPAEDPAPVVEAFYRRAARAEIAPRLDAACARSGTSYGRLTIRAQRTRWASCSSTGAMSFNWKLLLAPAAVLDYVVEHEVCHLEIRDHSPRFWALLESRVPEWRAASGWLRRYGPLLSLDSALRNAS
ncbi:MAG: Putative predicted metal-dependent hydrolase [uncultured Solirubrobacteraceae bacterium]|uniref:Predicted metal-dependent hydrolase n=1 Tax=uncultured Solirubrobacteraceae bacterium TaxID=1162706 RepID=A0A6J4R4N9_9ACTN|nr:MAG: Putative predicted metal-dependent hydrolase [uncultured Solirubrobacteraceae bacterium]